MGLGIDQTKRMTMSTTIMKAFVAALVLAGVSTAMVSDASAAWVGGGYHSDAYMAPRHNPTDTNGL
jgi:hypothetical protein